MPIRFTPMPTKTARAFQIGAPDAYGMPPEKAMSDGSGIPCRHCLDHVAKGEEYLILAYNPFPALQPYAETGPIFVHAKACAPYEGEGLPPIMAGEALVLLKAYNAEDRIIYGRGQLLPRNTLLKIAETELEDEGTAYLHVRSAYNNCFTFRIDRA